MTPLERIGIMTVFPLWRRNWIRNDRQDLKNILTNQLPEEHQNEQVLNLLKIRQRQVHNLMVIRALGLAGSIAAPLTTWYSLRHYDHKGQAIPFPFALYGGNIVGRMIGGIVTGRWSSCLHDKCLGSLPSSVYLRPEDM